MKFLKSYTYTWWQMGIFKLALLAIGAIAGSYWPQVVQQHIVVVAAVAVAASVYSMVVSLKQ